MLFEPEIETLPRRRLRELQSERLLEVSRYLYDRVELYRRRFDEADVKPDEIRSPDDLPRLPFTRKSDLRDTYPFGMFAVPMEEVVRMHASSGTTGHPTVVGYTRQDIDLFASVCARALASAGARPGMILHNAYGYGLFTGGLGLHYGGELLGLAVLPISAGGTERQVDLILDFQPKILCCTPSYALTLGLEMRRRGVDPGEVPLQRAVLGAEPWTEAMRSQIDESLGVLSTNCYGLSEIIGPGVAAECVEARQGSHLAEDHFLPEIVDPETGEVLPEGAEGVLVLTTLTKKALPLIRYWTGDVTSLTTDQCSCGRTLARMAPVKGRTDDMLIVRGVNVYPTQIEAVFGRFAELAPHYRLVLSRPVTLDELSVEVELSESFFHTITSDILTEEVVEADHLLRSLRGRLKLVIKQSVGVTAQVQLLAPGGAPRSEGGKVTRVVDRRQLA